MSPNPPNALERLADIEARLRSRRPVVFLDYDGTLTRIVARPELAVLGADVRATLARLARLAPVAVVSGRDLEDVRERVGLELLYAGSHGFDIAGPGGVRYEHPRGVATRPALDAAERQLSAALARVDGVLLERKRFSLAVHYRHVRAAMTPMVERAVDAALGLATGLRKTRGKSVFDLLPDFDWDKGAAVHWLLETLGLAGPDVLPLYIGDDLTDEDAFRALAGRGLGIAVLAEPRETAAQFRLRDPAEVCVFLGMLTDRLKRMR